jgi:hypothetical protein
MNYFTFAPALVLWELVDRGREQKNKNSSCRLRICFYLCNLLKKAEQVLLKFGIKKVSKEEKVKKVLAD